MKVHFQTELKLEKVVPVFKSSGSTISSNYGPISTLSFFAKQYEKLLHKYIIDFLDSNRAIYNHEKHSMQHAIISLIEKITESWESDDMVIGLFLKLKKNFDTVSNVIILLDCGL